MEGKDRSAYVWFSPFGLANHATAQKAAMKMMLTRRLQLWNCQRARTRVDSLERGVRLGVPVCHFEIEGGVIGLA